MDLLKQLVHSYPYQFAGVLTSVGALAIFGPRWKIARLVQYGKINTIGHSGYLWSTKEMKVLRTSTMAADSSEGLMDMSFGLNNDEVYAKALNFAKGGTRVRIEIEKNLFNYPWIAETNANVTNIEATE